MEKVGYKRPPKRTQFAKGKSGNPSGRPKGTRKLNSLANILNQEVMMTKDGVARSVPLAEATVTKLFQSALNGNASATRMALQLIEKAEQKQVEDERNPLGFCPPISRFVLSSGNAEECKEPLRRLDVIQMGEKAYRIETWVIEAALARNTGNHLSLREETIKKSPKPC